jgi:CO/xanthine dehydrogenase FAD-binding subunit
MRRPVILAPATLDELADVVTTHQDARIVGGGTLEIPSWTAEGVPRAAVHLSAVPELRARGTACCGAALTLADVAADRDMPPVLRDVAAACATPAIRELATVGGNLAACRTGCVTVALLALRARVTVLRDGVPDDVPLARYLDDPAGVIVRTSWPRGPAAGATRRLTLQERAGAVLLTVAVTRADGWTVAVGGMGARPQRLTGVESLLDAGVAASGALAAVTGRDLKSRPSAVVIDDDYQRHLAGVLVSRAVADMCEERT